MSRDVTPDDRDELHHNSLLDFGRQIHTANIGTGPQGVLDAPSRGRRRHSAAGGDDEGRAERGREPQSRRRARYARRLFQGAMGEELTRSVEQLTGRRVIALMSDNHLDPDMAVEVFILDGPLT